MGTSTTTYIGLIYGVSILIASVAGMGSAFLANRIYPLKGGDEPPPPTAAEVASAVKKAEKADTEASKLADKLAAADPNAVKQPEPPVVEEKEEEAPEIEDEEEEAPPELEDKKEIPDRTKYIQDIQKTFKFPNEEYAEDTLDILETPRQSLSTMPNLKSKLIQLLGFLTKKENATPEVVNLTALLAIKIGKDPIAGADEQIPKDLQKLIYPTAGESDT